MPLSVAAGSEPAAGTASINGGDAAAGGTPGPNFVLLMECVASGSLEYALKQGRLSETRTPGGCYWRSRSEFQPVYFLPLRVSFVR